MASIRTYSRKDGKTSWYVCWRENGKQTSAAFTDEKTAAIFRAHLENAGADAAWQWLRNHDPGKPPDGTTVDAHVQRYISNLTGIQEGTRVDYRRKWANSFAPLIGHLPVAALTRDHLTTAINMLAPRLAPKTITNAYMSILVPALRDAVERQMIPKLPATNIRMPRADRADDQVMFLDPDEFLILYNQIPEFWQPLVLTLVGTGARWSEATAWQVRDIDLNDGTIRVARAWKRADVGWELGPPKTKRGRRTIALGRTLVETLRPLVVGRPAEAWLFTSTDGKSRVYHRNFHQRVWRPAVWRAIRCQEHRNDPNPCGCRFSKPRVCPMHRTEPVPCECPGTLTRAPRIHDLRHTHASWLISDGVALPVIQRRLGHESIKMTVDVYGDLIPDVQLRAAAAVDDFLEGFTRPAIEAPSRPDTEEE